MRYRSIVLILAGLIILWSGCEEVSDHEKYQRPDWLPGKLYTTVSTRENLSLFTECLRLTGLDTIVDVSGCFTVFAPTDAAMEQYLSANQYAGVADIPPEELERIVEFHIIQNPWTLEQLQTLSAYGWRTGDNTDWDTYAYKRKTIFKRPVEKYWITREKKQERIVMDSMVSDGYKRVHVESRKYVPIFYDDYVNAVGLTSEDFSFYFDRAYEPGNVFYAGARIVEADIFAENGFVHIIDRVVNPMLNAEELLHREFPGESYKLFLEMIYWYFPTFEPNEPATMNQPEVRLGGVVDTLWDLEYYDLAFAIQKERIGNETAHVNQSLVRHNGMFVPVDAAFREFIDGILTVASGYPHWRDIRSLPRDVSEIIIARHLKSVPIYPSNYQYYEIFWADGNFQQNEGDIIRKEFGSNCTFIGLGSYQPDRLFTSVTGPVFLRPAYSLFRRALQYSDIGHEIAGHPGELCFFPIPDFSLETDSSLMLNWTDFENDEYNFLEFDRSRNSIQFLSPRELGNRIMNHVGTSLPDGSANKEFIRTLGGNYIIWNHLENTVRGSLPCTVGYNGDVVKTSHPAQLHEPSDNGEVWSVRYWLNNENADMRTLLSRYPEFFSLLLKAGLFDPYSTGQTFLDRNENYTVFIPSAEAINNCQADTMGMEVLEEFLKGHFLQGAIIFTDNKQPSGVYDTMSGAKLDIRTGPDLIEILDNNGDTHVMVREEENTTNIMVSERSEVTSVAHEIDQVLFPD